MMRNSIIELVDASEISNKDEIKSLLLPSIGFKITQHKYSQNFSRIGGHPPILENQWPVFENKPLTFIGQISLSQIKNMNNVLPKNGVLCFFILAEGTDYRYPDERGEFKVVYVESEAQFVETPLTIEKKTKVISEFFLDIYEFHSFPSYQDFIVEKSNIQEEELEKMYELEDDFRMKVHEDYDIGHQVLGHPTAIQGTVKFWWAAKYLGFKDRHAFSQEEIKLIKEAEENFILLLQLNFDDAKIHIDYFGDSVAYFGIHKNDLANKNFDDVVLVLQNT